MSRSRTGEPLEVSAEVLDTDEDEEVHLVYSTVDGQRIEETVAMTATAGGVRFAGQCPRPGRSQGVPVGVQQELLYWIEAGDARSRQFRVRVFSRPTIVVQKVLYEFPAYTGYPAQTAENTGNLGALEGTRVTLTALANHPIEAAYVDFEADGRHDVPLKVDGLQATAQFVLALRDDRRTPTHTSYVLRLQTTEGRHNVDPVKYQIDVTPDYAPEIELVEPVQEQVDLRHDQTLRLTVEARDPDFALANVRIVGRVASSARPTTSGASPLRRACLASQVRTEAKTTNWACCSPNLTPAPFAELCC